MVRVPEITNESRLRLTLRIDFCASFKTLSGEQPFKGSRSKSSAVYPSNTAHLGAVFGILLFIVFTAISVAGYWF